LKRHARSRPALLVLALLLSGCGRQAPVAPPTQSPATVAVTAGFDTIRLPRTGEKTKTVDYYGCRGRDIPEAALNWLADSVDYLANTRPLVFATHKYD